MKKQILIIVFFLPFFLYSQELSVFYEVKYVPKKNCDSTKKELLVLEIDLAKKKSFFYSYAKVKSDSLYQEINKSDGEKKKHLISILPTHVFNLFVIKNYVDNRLQIIEKFDANYFTYTQENTINWKTNLKGNKIIMGYNCKRATSSFHGREWEAWYSEEIPINDGPFKFFGLPGLILEINSNDNDYKIVSKSIIKKINNLILPQNIINVNNYETVLKLKKEYVDNPSARSKQEDLKDGFSGDSYINGKKFSAEESYKFLNEELWNWMKLYNNPIEKDDIWVR